MFKTLKALFTPTPRFAPADVADRVRSGAALLIDVREPREWKSGVAASAALLPLSDLHGARRLWQPFLAEAGGRELLCYCAAGVRSAAASRVLAGEGFRAANSGCLADWADAGWPIVAPAANVARSPKKGTP